MQTRELTGPDLNYWVARANMFGSPQDVNVLRCHYGSASVRDPIDEASKRVFVEGKLGPVLPERIHWQ